MSIEANITSAHASDTTASDAALPAGFDVVRVGHEALVPNSGEAKPATIQRMVVSTALESLRADFGVTSPIEDLSALPSLDRVFAVPEFAPFQSLEDAPTDVPSLTQVFATPNLAPPHAIEYPQEDLPTLMLDLQVSEVEGLPPTENKWTQWTPVSTLTASEETVAVSRTERNAAAIPERLLAADLAIAEVLASYSPRRMQALLTRSNRQDVRSDILVRIFPDFPA